MPPPSRSVPELASPAAPRGWRNAGRVGQSVLLLAWLPTLGLVALALLPTSLPLCGFRALTGLPCPLCGGTHACAAVMTGNLVRAIQANAGVVVILALALVHSVGMCIRLWRPDFCLAPGFWTRCWLASLAVLLALWGWRLATSPQPDRVTNQAAESPATRARSATTPGSSQSGPVVSAITVRAAR